MTKKEMLNEYAELISDNTHDDYFISLFDAEIVVEKYANQEKEKEAIAFKDWCDENEMVLPSMSNEALYELYKTN